MMLMRDGVGHRPESRETQLLAVYGHQTQLLYVSLQMHCALLTTMIRCKVYYHVNEREQKETETNKARPYSQLCTNKGV